MKKPAEIKPKLVSTRKTPGDDEPSLHRSGVVARMLRMPVATLRVWERRYAVTQPILSPTGQRLYSASDIQRLALLKQLTDLGHAIGSLVPMDLAQLQRVSATHGRTLAATQTPDRVAAEVPPVRAWRLAVIGAALGNRLRRPALLRRLGRPVILLGAFADATHAAAALQGSAIDALLIHEPYLHEGWLAAIDAAAPALAAVPKAVLYAFASESVCEALATDGTALLREPQTDVVLAQWLNNLAAATTIAATPRHDLAYVEEPMPERRWTDASLAEFAGIPSTVACECPRQVAELLMQLSHFEAYSAECARRSVADAELHAYLRRVAAASRVRFEAALEHVALYEGLILPATSPNHGDTALVPKARRAQPSAGAARRRS